MANDGAQNYLYQNDGNGQFTEVGYQAGVALDENGKALANMGVALGDYLHTGRFSIAITHFSEQYLEVFRNDGDLSFTDVSNVSRIARVDHSTWSAGETPSTISTTTDGLTSLRSTAMYIHRWIRPRSAVRFREPGQLFLNQRDGTFRDVSDQVGRGPQASREWDAAWP